MDGLDIIIKQLHGARRDLKALNDKPCRCDAYAFPHRKGGGECMDEGETSEAADCLVSYHYTRRAMLDAGHKESDFS